MPKPSIVFLDAATVDFGDIDISKLRQQGNYQAYQNSTLKQILTRCKKAEIIITNKCVFDKKLLSKLRQLKLLCIAATGVNNIDLDAAQQQNIAITNVAGYSTNTVAEHTMAFLLNLSHRINEHHNASLKGHWFRSPHFALLDYPFKDLAGKILGIIGYGNIGKKVARLAKAFNMKVQIAKIPGRTYKKTSGRTSLAQVLKQSDYVSLHCPLSRHTHHLMNEKRLNQMKPTACLLNLARGAVVDEKAIAKALTKNKINFYATDVTSFEPPPKTNPLFHKKLRDKVLITPHIAWASVESRQCLMDEITQNIAAFLKGKKRNRIV